MNILSLLSSDVAYSRTFRRLDGLTAYIVLGSRSVKGYVRGLKRYLCRDCRRTFNDKTGRYSTALGLGVVMLMLSSLGLHNSCLGLSWLLSRSPMTVFKALRRLMLRLRDKASHVKLKGVVEADELYVNAGLKGWCSSARIKRLGPRHRAFRRQTCGV